MLMGKRNTEINYQPQGQLTMINRFDDLHFELWLYIRVDSLIQRAKAGNMGLQILLERLICLIDPVVDNLF